MYLIHRFVNAEVWDCSVGHLTLSFTPPQAKYKQFLYSGDVVLLELASPLRLNERIGSACLTERAMIDEEQLCLTAGWGVDPAEVANTEQYLKYLPVPTMPTEKCNSSLHYNGSLNDDAICAGYLSSSKTTCYVSPAILAPCQLQLSNFRFPHRTTKERH